MKRYKIKSALLLCLIWCCTGCDALWNLNMDPGKPVYDGTANESMIKSQLVASYSYLLYANTFGQYYWGDIGGCDTDESYRNDVASNRDVIGAHNITPSSTQLTETWKNYWKMNECAANVLLMLKNAPELSKVVADDYRGQAMVMMAMSHFILAQYFGPIPIKNIPTYEMGLTAELKREPIKDVCQYALDNCRNAIPLLRSITTTKTTASVTKEAAEALSYRIALYMASHPDIADTEKYNDVTRWADAFITTGPCSLNESELAIDGKSVPAYARLFVRNMQSNGNWDPVSDHEGIWSVQFFCKSNTSGIYANTRYKCEDFLGSYMGLPCADDKANSKIGYSALTYRALNNLYNKYTDFNNGADYPLGDLRRDWNIPTFCYKYKVDDVKAPMMEVTEKFPYFKVILPNVGANAISCTKEATLIPIFNTTTWGNENGKVTSIYIENGGEGYRNANGESSFTYTMKAVPMPVPFTIASVDYSLGAVVGYKYSSQLITGKTGVDEKHNGHQQVQACNKDVDLFFTFTDGKIESIEKRAKNSSSPTTADFSNNGFSMVTDRGIGKWRREYEVDVPQRRERDKTSCHFPILRFADVLLMASEAHINGSQGVAQIGLEYLNMVRRRAYGVPANVANANVDFATYDMQTIMDERSRELCFEGVRRNDLIRWGAYQGANNVIDDVMNNKINPQDAKIISPIQKLRDNYKKYVLLPIPQTEMGLSSNTFYQNPGW